MTWTKLGDEYSDEIATAGLSDAAYRTHTEAIGWLYRLEDTTLRIPKHLIRRFAGSEDHQEAVKELADLGFWRDRGDAWEVVHHADVIRQSIQAQRQKRERDKRAQQARRDRTAAAARARSVSDGVSADVSGRVSGDTDRQTDRQTKELPIPAPLRTRQRRAPRVREGGTNDRCPRHH
jgi:hypothetical protein